MRDFRSVCWRQMELIIIIPHSDNSIKGNVYICLLGLRF